MFNVHLLPPPFNKTNMSCTFGFTDVHLMFWRFVFSLAKGRETDRDHLRSKHFCHQRESLMLFDDETESSFHCMELLHQQRSQFFFHSKCTCYACLNKASTMSCVIDD